jgi:hypothetical protein
MRVRERITRARAEEPRGGERKRQHCSLGMLRLAQLANGSVAMSEREGESRREDGINA